MLGGDEEEDGGSSSLTCSAAVSLHVQVRQFLELTEILICPLGKTSSLLREYVCQGSSRYGRASH